LVKEQFKVKNDVDPSQLLLLPAQISFLALHFSHTLFPFFSRLNFAKTIGRDTDNDGRPDIPLRFEFDDSKSVIQFPLGFCPGDFSDPDNPQINFQCTGEWGFVLKEWQTIFKVRSKKI
jgi:hypothetical protein